MIKKLILNSFLAKNFISLKYFSVNIYVYNFEELCFNYKDIVNGNFRVIFSFVLLYQSIVFLHIKLFLIVFYTRTNKSNFSK